MDPVGGSSGEEEDPRRGIQGGGSKGEDPRGRIQGGGSRRRGLRAVPEAKSLGQCEVKGNISRT